MSDFFDTDTGNAQKLRRRNRWKNRLLDHLADRRLRRTATAVASAQARVLVVGVEVPKRRDDIHAVIGRLSAGSRHAITVSVVPMGSRGKFENINAAIDAATLPLADVDWVVVTDDDIAFAPGFLDTLIALAAQAGFAIAQPAHAFESHATFEITRRVRGSLARRTKFVEIGPLTLIHSSGFDAFLPFPESRWCYGIDLVWSEVADRAGLSMGIVDGAPVRHLRPVAASYDMQAALDEGRALLKRMDVRRGRDVVFGTSEIVVPPPD